MLYLKEPVNPEYRKKSKSSKGRRGRVKTRLFNNSGIPRKGTPEYTAWKIANKKSMMTLKEKHRRKRLGLS